MKALWVILSLTFATVTQAALPARIVKGDLKIFAAPNTAAKVLATLPEGTAFEASNYPIDGFYKVRLDDGLVGWAQMGLVTLFDPETQDIISKPHWGKLVKPSFFIRPSGGANLLIYPGLTTNFPDDFTSMGLSFYGALDFQYLLSSGSGFFLRSEYVMWSGTGLETTDTYSLRAIPIHLGLIIQLIDGGRFTMKLNVGGGVSVLNRFDVKAAESEIISYINPMMIFGGIGMLQFNYHFTDSVGIFLEVGGRMLFSSANTFTADDDNTPISLEQDLLMYGPSGGIGFSIGF